MASINAEPTGLLRVAGVLDHAQAGLLREQGRRLIQANQASQVVLDFSAVERANSAGLSLILCLLRDAQARGLPLRIQGLPSELRQLAQVSGLSQVLELG